MRIVDSARKHGIEDADIWHAIRNVINPGFERGDLLMLLGPAQK
jgi:hypothetical protein